MMEEETGYIILDVRTAQEYSEKHIPGAINIANEADRQEWFSCLQDCKAHGKPRTAEIKMWELAICNHSPA